MNHILRIVAAHVLLSMLVVPAGVAMADRNSNHSNQHTGSRAVSRQAMLAGARAKLPPPTPATPGSQMIWNFTSDGGVSSSPALSSDGKVLYVGSEDSNLYSVDAATGSNSVRFPCRQQRRQGGARRGVPKARWFAISDAAILDAVDAVTGRKIWNFTTGALLLYFRSSSPILSSDGTVVYIGSPDGHLYAIWDQYRHHHRPRRPTADALECKCWP